MSYTIQDSNTINDISVVTKDNVEGNAFVLVQLLNLVMNSRRKAYWMKETPEITILVQEKILTHPFGNVYAVGDVSLAKKMADFSRLLNLKWLYALHATSIALLGVKKGLFEVKMVLFGGHQIERNGKSRYVFLTKRRASQRLAAEGRPLMIRIECAVGQRHYSAPPPSA